VPDNTPQRQQSHVLARRQHKLALGTLKLTSYEKNGPKMQLSKNIS
jgi:hypothetical protein